MSSCQARSAVPATNATSSSAFHARACGTPCSIAPIPGRAPAIGAAVNNESSGCCRRSGIRARIEPPALRGREYLRMDESDSPQRVLNADPEDADAIDDRAREVDLARIVEVARRT